MKERSVCLSDGGGRTKYFTDEAGDAQGLFLGFSEEGYLCTRCIFLDDKWHGEYVRYDKEGSVIEREFYEHGVRIVLPPHMNTLNLTDEDLFELRFTHHEIQYLPEMGE